MRQRIRGVTTMRYINPLLTYFAYLLTSNAYLKFTTKLLRRHTVATSGPSVSKNQVKASDLQMPIVQCPSGTKM